MSGQPAPVVQSVIDDGPNVRFAHADPNTGQIVMTGTCPPRDYPDQPVPPGLVLMPVADDVRSASHKIDFSGKVPSAVALTQQEIDVRKANDPVTLALASLAAAKAAVAKGP